MSPPKTALVTGCSAGGIGAALALALSKRGLHVFATARNPAKIPAELSRLANNVTVLPLSLDVTSAASVAAAVAAVEESGAGGLDMLVNNAGAGYAMPLLDVDIAAAQELYETNLWGVLRMVQGFAGLLIARRGHVVNISSVGSLLNTPWIGKCLMNSIAAQDRTNSMSADVSWAPWLLLCLMYRHLRLLQSCSQHPLRDSAARAGSLWCQCHDGHGGHGGDPIPRQ